MKIFVIFAKDGPEITDDVCKVLSKGDVILSQYDASYCNTKKPSSALVKLTLVR